MTSEAYEARQWDVFCENNDLRLDNDQLRELGIEVDELGRQKDNTGD